MRMLLALVLACTICTGQGLLAGRRQAAGEVGPASYRLSTWRRGQSISQAPSLENLRVISGLLYAFKPGVIEEEMYGDIKQLAAALAADEDLLTRQLDAKPIKSLMPLEAKTSKPQRRKKVLIIMSDTGGGHKASGKAIASALQQLYPRKLDIKIIDMLACNCQYPFKASVKTYQYVAKHPILWKILYEYSRFPLTCWLSQRIAVANCWEGFITRFMLEDPDLVISVHPLMQHLPLRVINFMYGGEEIRRKHLPFVTVVTDLGGGHPLWLCQKTDKTYVPSEAFERIAKRKGIPKDKLCKYGLPIRPGFQARNSREKNYLRARIGLHQGVRTALVVGGGDGVGKIDKIAIELAQALGRDGGGPAQVAVICGKNDKLKAKLEREAWPENVFVSVQGFVDRMDKWMGAADCIVTKAGPGTIAEACSSGLPIMLSDYLPGQEYPNMRFVVSGGLGAFSKRPQVIGKTVSRWLTDPQLLAQMSRKSSKVGNPEASKKIAADIGQQLFRRV